MSALLSTNSLQNVLEQASDNTRVAISEDIADAPPVLPVADRKNLEVIPRSAVRLGRRFVRVGLLAGSRHAVEHSSAKGVHRFLIGPHIGGDLPEAARIGVVAV